MMKMSFKKITTVIDRIVLKVARIVHSLLVTITTIVDKKNSYNFR